MIADTVSRDLGPRHTVHRRATGVERLKNHYQQHERIEIEKSYETIADTRAPLSPHPRLRKIDNC